ncbi:MAG: universal stress protein [Ginsengibacter sp.]|jgi:nucleotide-binding universal stress UspA family protein
MQKILVPTDFSKNATKAITYASEVAQKTGATIYLMHSIEISINMATMQSDSSNPKVVKERSEMLKLSIDSVNAIYPGVKVITHLSGGGPVESILDFSEKEKMDLIIMGTTGASGLKKIFMGSVASGTIAKTTIPVLTIPAAYDVEEPDAILFATNHFEKNKNILNRIINLSSIFSTSIHVVVFKETDREKYADLIYNEEQLNDYLQFLKESFPTVDFKAGLLEGNDFEMSIEEYSNEHGIDIIALVTYPKSFLERILQKSVTKQMAFHSTTPLLAIPANCSED